MRRALRFLEDVLVSQLRCGEMLALISLGLVGVGGYLLQGGISFLSAQYGLAADVRVICSREGPCC